MTTGLIICGALAHEVLAIIKKHQWDVKIVAVPAIDHAFPQRIAPDVEKRICELKAQFERLIVVFGDCGTGGTLDVVLDKYGVERLEGMHCYEWYGGKQYDDLMEEELGTYFLTDFMVRTFKGMILKSMGLDKYPQLRDEYFKHYKRIVYLVQKPDPVLIEKAKAAANFLGLPLEVRATGYNRLEKQLVTLMAKGGNETIISA